MKDKKLNRCSNLISDGGMSLSVEFERAKVDLFAFTFIEKVRKRIYDFCSRCAHSNSNNFWTIFVGEDGYAKIFNRTI